MNSCMHGAALGQKSATDASSYVNEISRETSSESTYKYVAVLRAAEQSAARDSQWEYNALMTFQSL